MRLHPFPGGVPSQIAALFGFAGFWRGRAFAREELARQARDDVEQRHHMVHAERFSRIARSLTSRENH